MSEATYYYDIEQGSDAWLSARLGIPTASELNAIVTPKGAISKGEGAKTYACQKAAERETKFLEEHYESYDMARGSFQEGIAREVYHDNYSQVQDCGFITRNICGVNVGCSPDGLIGDDGGIEIKSRLSKFQVKTIITDEVPDDYKNQLQAFLLVSGRDWIDFVQYSNGMPLFVKRVYPDAKRQNAIVNAILNLETMIAQMQSKYKEVCVGLIQTERVEIEFSDDVITESGE